MKILLGLAFCVLSISLHGQFICTFAGSGSIGSAGNLVPANTAQLNNPQGICSDKLGNIYIADYENHVIRKVDSNGIISTFAGNYTVGYSGDGGFANTAQLRYPYSVCADNTGNIYISDEGACVIRKVNTQGIISTFAGNGNCSYSGDGGQAIQAGLKSPTDICADNAGNIYFVDFVSCVVRRISTDGIITTIAGNGTHGYSGDGGPAVLAQFNSPIGISVDNGGNIYVADVGNNLIRKINSDGLINTFAGGGSAYNDNVSATATSLNAPFGVLVAASGDVYIGDNGNNRIRVVKSGIISTAAGNGILGYSGDSGLAINAQLSSPSDLCMDGYNNMYVVDPGNFVIRKISSCSFLKITQQPANSLICGTNGNASFTVNAVNYNKLRWQQETGNNNWIDINDNSLYAGSNSNILSIIGAGTGNSNTHYRCWIGNDCGHLLSNIAGLTLSIPETPAVEISASANEICQGGIDTFIAKTKNGGLNPVYQWAKNGIAVVADDSLYIDNNLKNGDLITCVLVSSFPCLIQNNVVSNTSSVIVHPQPANFCPPDTSICFYKTLLLKATPGYQTYLWNTQFAGSTLAVTRPGNYWLSVTDSNHCTTIDTVVVKQQDCLKGFFVPSAFSPNQDDRNESFKPLIFEDVKSYHLTIFNSWGEIIYDTANPNAGWDGNLKGKKQPAGIYLWNCRYRVVNRLERVKNGTVLLIR